MATKKQVAPRLARVTITGLSPYTQGRAFPYGAKREADETADQFDERMWRKRAHFRDGKAVIPGSSLHKALIAAAKFRGERIPGEGKKTWTKRFGAGVLVLTNPRITPETTEDELECCVVHVPSDGRPGGSTRVWRRFPIWDEGWAAEVEIVVVDALIDEETFRRHLETAGKFVGIGTHRPSSNSPGTNGRFSVGKISWSEA